MKIGLDIDETLIYSFEDFLGFYNEMNNTTHKKEENTSEKKFHEFLGITKQQLLDWYKEYEKHERAINLKPVEGAREVLKELVSNHEFVLITARQEAQAAKTKSLVDKHFGEFDFKIVFNKPGLKLDKGTICVNEGIKVMIDDDIDNALNCVNKGVKVVLLNKPWNQRENHKDITRVNNWAEILEEIKKLEDSNGS